jgi:hypothetical protein
MKLCTRFGVMPPMRPDTSRKAGAGTGRSRAPGRACRNDGDVFGQKVSRDFLLKERKRDKPSLWSAWFSHQKIRISVPKRPSGVDFLRDVPTSFQGLTPDLPQESSSSSTATQVLPLRAAAIKSRTSGGKAEMLHTVRERGPLEVRKASRTR